MAATATKPAAKAALYDRPEEQDRTSPTAGTPLLDAAIAATTKQLEATSKSYADAVADPARGRLERAMLQAEAIKKLEDQMPLARCSPTRCAASRCRSAGP